MADRVAIFDPDLQLGAVVDTEEMRALGPVGGGPNARAELTQFINHMPEATWNLSTYDLRDAYMQFWDANFAALYEQDGSGGDGQVVAPADTGDAQAALAEHEASAAGAEPPPPQPADADTEAQPEAAQYVGPCFACQGSGHVAGGADGAQVQCNLCQGTGKLPVEAATA